MGARLLLLLGALAAPAAAQDGGRNGGQDGGQDGAPLSAIDWLSQSVAPVAGAAAVPRLVEPPVASSPGSSSEPPVSGDARAPGVVVTPLDGAAPDAGVLPPEVTGLPRELWRASDPARLRALVAAQPADAPPALRELLVTLMLAEADPPAAGGGRDFFLARVDKLLDLGALEAARALLEAGDLEDPEAFRRWFDVTLLTGQEAAACEMLRGRPALAPTLEARVFCLARNGDWNAAALTLNTAQALGDVTPEAEALLARFLDPELVDPEAPLLPPARPSPLVFRLREAIGETVPTADLPLAFAHADLRPQVAWRAQIEAAERLARGGVLSENVLLGLYTARDPAASGGVWDRAALMQRLDAALAEGDGEAVAAALPDAWAAMEAAGLLVPFGRMLGGRLAALDLPGEAGALAYRAALLSPAYEAAARAREPASEAERLWRAIATGEAEGVEAADALGAAALAGLSDAPVPESLAALVAEGRTGEAALLAAADLARGRDGDHAAVEGGLAALRALGLGDAGRRAALQLLLAERP